jgi:signal transduction histidine kinase
MAGMELVFDYTTSTSAGCAREQDRMDRFIACVQMYIGHELPTQLMAMQAFSRLLLDQYAGALDEEGRMMLDRLAAGAERAEALARRLAEMGRLLREPPWGLPMSANEIVREAIAELNVLGTPPGVSYDIQERLPSVHTSRRLLHQVLVQLLRNAVGALTSRKDGVVRASDLPGGTIAIGGKREPGGVSLWVRDTGRGMTQSQAGQFEPFVAGRFGGAQGAGLGLFLVCQAVARWGGILRVQSHAGQGTTFSLFLPDGPESDG